VPASLLLLLSWSSRLTAEHWRPACGAGGGQEREPHSGPLCKPCLLAAPLPTPPLPCTPGRRAPHPQVLERLKEPLKSLIARDDPGTAYAVLAHVLLLVKRAPIIFEDQHAAFYCRAHDPW